ncbi:TPA: glycosyltransferase, partial [Salmonella enterica subsp. enterica serovar Mgulani]|nr:glycosyltransferase [Salmonella enterica]EEL1950129.1 glycosyltransferase family 2 protein [Salmonella enterica]
MRVLYSFIKRMILSIHYYLFSMAFLSFNVKKRYADRLEFDNYVSTKLKKQVENKKKLPSVAAIYRVKNGAEYIEASILSISSFATQIIVVDNNSMDNTKNIVEKLSNELRDVCDIKLFSYNKKLAIAGSGYIDRVSNGDGSLAEFYNFCFSLTECEYVMKVDAHYIFSAYGIDILQKQIAKKYDGVVFRGVEIFGKWMSNELFLYRRSLGLKYIDGELYERLVWSKKNTHIRTIIKPLYLHVKRLAYAKYLY